MELPDDWEKQIKAAYPKRSGDQGWNAVRALIPKRIAEGSTWIELLEGAKRYAEYCKQQSMVGGDFVKQARTFYGPERWFEEWAEKDVRTDAERAMDAKWSQLDQRATVLGITLNRAQGYDYAMQGVLQAEKQAQNAMWEARGMNQPKFAVVK